MRAHAGARHRRGADDRQRATSRRRLSARGLAGQLAVELGGRSDALGPSDERAARAQRRRQHRLPPAAGQGAHARRCHRARRRGDRVPRTLAGHVGRRQGATGRSLFNDGHPGGKPACAAAPPVHLQLLRRVRPRPDQPVPGARVHGGGHPGQVFVSRGDAVAARAAHGERAASGRGAAAAALAADRRRDTLPPLARHRPPGHQVLQRAARRGADACSRGRFWHLARLPARARRARQTAGPRDRPPHGLPRLKLRHAALHASLGGDQRLRRWRGPLASRVQQEALRARRVRVRAAAARGAPRGPRLRTPLAPRCILCRVDGRSARYRPHLAARRLPGTRRPHRAVLAPVERGAAASTGNRRHTALALAASQGRGQDGRSLKMKLNTSVGAASMP
mmetsp:Transcript_56754/g.156014  ORF Transcript_56754/g.156014 Transcript_56754/m.156014 type:complete len:394 (+) Transcript_56754:1079-2260(+)